MGDNQAIPGVILAFGDRIQVGDEQVVSIEPKIRDTARMFTGRWQTSVDIMVVGQDTDQQERIVDYLISIFWAEYQDRLVDEGINVYDFSLSGESEELEIEEAEEYNFVGGLSFTAETDWQLKFPLLSEVRRINIAFAQDSLRQTLTDEKEGLLDQSYDGRMINSGHQIGLQVDSPLPVVVQPSSIRVKTRVYPKDP